MTEIIKTVRKPYGVSVYTQHEDGTVTREVHGTDFEIPEISEGDETETEEETPEEVEPEPERKPITKRGKR